MGGKLVPRAGEVLLDAAVVASFRAGFEGRVLLYFDHEAYMRSLEG
jgi:hypothetical protein